MNGTYTRTHSQSNSLGSLESKAGAVWIYTYTTYMESVYGRLTIHRALGLGRHVKKKKENPHITDGQYKYTA